MTFLTEPALSEFRAVLLADRAAVLGSVTSLSRDADTLAESQLSPDNRIRSEGDGDTVAVERHLVAQLGAQAQAALADIDAALARLEAGTFGRCESCTKPIPVERLEVRPRTAHCVPCASRR